MVDAVPYSSPEGELRSRPCSYEPPGVDWQHLSPQVTRLINRVTPGNMGDTVSRFLDLGFPWAQHESIDGLAKLLVSASASHGFYAEAFGQLVCDLISRCDKLQAATEATTQQPNVFANAIKVALSEQFCAVLSAMSAESEKQVSPETRISCPRSMQPYPGANKLRDKLVNLCKLAASLLHLKIHTVEDIRWVLQCLGALRPQLLTSAGLTAEQQAEPRIVLLSGACPLTQPAHGDLMNDWRERFAREIGLPPNRIGLLAGDAEVPIDACLDGIHGMMQALINPLIIVEEYRVEAVCALLSKIVPDLTASVEGELVLRQVLEHLAAIRLDLPKRAQFFIMDLETAERRSHS